MGFESNVEPVATAENPTTYLTNSPSSGNETEGAGEIQQITHPGNLFTQQKSSRWQFLLQRGGNAKLVVKYGVILGNYVSNFRGRGGG